jgi:5-methylcytosine-specific restriction enzyme subunit McrC
MILPEIFLARKGFSEHHQDYYKYDVLDDSDVQFFINPIYFKGLDNVDNCCFNIVFNQPRTSYYIGVDWLNETHNKAVYVQPKRNVGDTKIDYLGILFDLMNRPEIFDKLQDIYEIKWEAPTISIYQQQDHLTPLLVVQFLQVLQRIVRKGLKKGYYPVTHNLRARVKGKILVGETIKQNLLKNRTLNTYCTYQQFGFDHLENRLLKKALLFVQRYLSVHQINTGDHIQHLFNYILPAFADVSDDISLQELKNPVTNPFYKDYKEGILLAKQILRRFGFNINNTTLTEIKTPPFWIDMSLLFELYVYGQLKEIYGKTVEYQFPCTRGFIDFLITKPGEEMIIDAKYKPKYIDDYVIEDIRQLSGYARDIRVLKALGFSPESQQFHMLVKCLIIYPDQTKDEKLAKNEIEDIKAFLEFRKQAVRMPELKKITL